MAKKKMSLEERLARMDIIGEEEETRAKKETGNKNLNIQCKIASKVQSKDDIPTAVPRYNDNPTLDELLNGGIAQGRWTHLWGKKSSGKTNLAMKIARQAQDMGLLVAWIDLEGKWDTSWARDYHDMDIDNLMVVKSEKIDYAFNTLFKWVKEGLVDLVIIDSIAAGSYSNEKENIEDRDVGIRARGLTKFLRLATSYIDQHDITFVLINQVQQEIGHVSYLKFPGGNQLEHMIDINIYLKSKGKEGVREVEMTLQKTKKYGVIENSTTVTQLTPAGFKDIAWIPELFEKIDGYRMLKNGVKYGKPSEDNITYAELTILGEKVVKYAIENKLAYKLFKKEITKQDIISAMKKNNKLSSEKKNA